MSAADPLRCVEVALTRHRPITRLWVSFSGGLDSHVLLHRLATQRAYPKASIGVVHVHHGLQRAAADWVAHCRSVCWDLRFTLRVLHVEVRAGSGGSPEEAARRARYAALKRLLKSGEVLVTAHHLDDQAETLLLQLARGAGIPGLAAMPECMTLGSGRLLRPLLEVPSDRLVAYAEQHGLRWVDDPSNLDQRFDRNFIRHGLMPQLQARWPAFSANVARSARHCGEAGALLEALAAEDLQRLQQGPGGSLRIDLLQQLPRVRQRNAVRHWIRRLRLPVPASKQLEELFRTVIQARSDRQPRLRWPGAEVRRYRDQLFAMPPLPAVPADWRVAVVLNSRVQVPGGGTVEFAADCGGRISPARLSGRVLELGFRRPGGRLRLKSAGPRRLLKDLFQQAGVPPWVRERTPTLYADGKIVAVAGLWTNAEFEASEGEVGAALRWQEKPAFGSLAAPYG